MKRQRAEHPWIYSDAEVELRTSPGELEVRGGKLESVLYYQGRPLAMDAYDCEGSVGRFTILKPGEVARPDAEWLQRFVPGRYRVTLSDTESWFDPLEECPAEVGLGYHRGYYEPDLEPLVTTQHKLDLDVVERWLKALERGERPAVITASQVHDHTSFVLDGHHKLEAYTYARLPVRILSFTRLDPRPFPSRDTREFFADSPVRSYLRARSMDR